MIIQTFYNGVIQPAQSTIDAATGVVQQAQFMLFMRLVVCKGIYVPSATMVLLPLDMPMSYIVLTHYYRTIATLIPTTLDGRVTLTLSTRNQTLNPRILCNCLEFSTELLITHLLNLYNPNLTWKVS